MITLPAGEARKVIDAAMPRRWRSSLHDLTAHKYCLIIMRAALASRVRSCIIIFAQCPDQIEMSVISLI